MTSITKYNPDTGEPYQVPVTRYTMFDKSSNSLVELLENRVIQGQILRFHCAMNILDIVKTRPAQWKEEVIFGIEIERSDWYHNLKSLSLTEIEKARTQVIEFVSDYHPDLEVLIYLVLAVSY